MANMTQQQQAIFDEMNMAEKIAILLLQLGEEATAAIFSNMNVDAITEVSKFIASNNTIDRAVATAVLEEFHAIF
jgi:flagellar motor switch protein FliG